MATKKAAAAPQEAPVTKKTPAKKAAAAPAPAPAPVAPVAEEAAPTKKSSKKAVTTPAAAPAAEAAPAKRANSAFMKPLTPSAALAAVVGKKALPRTEVTKKLWAYIKKHNLQDAEKRTLINADAKLKAVLGKDQVTMFEMTKLVSPHLK